MTFKRSGQLIQVWGVRGNIGADLLWTITFDMRSPGEVTVLGDAYKKDVLGTQMYFTAMPFLTSAQLQQMLMANRLDMPGRVLKGWGGGNEYDDTLMVSLEPEQREAVMVWLDDMVQSKGSLGSPVEVHGEAAQRDARTVNRVAETLEEDLAGDNCIRTMHDAITLNKVFATYEENVRASGFKPSVRLSEQVDLMTARAVRKCVIRRK